MTGTPTERAALLSARIHREVNAKVVLLEQGTYIERHTDKACCACALGAAAFVLGREVIGYVADRYDCGDTLSRNGFSHSEIAQLEIGFENYGQCVYFDVTALVAADVTSPFWRLGAELRAIVLGNREERR